MLLNNKAWLAVPIDQETKETWLPERNPDVNSEELGLKRMTITNWLEQMSRSRFNLQDRMSFFHHTFFTTVHARVYLASALYYQNKLIHQYALGSIKTLAAKICVDNAMLMNLDGKDNRSTSPNENFAREFLELYSIGKGVDSTVRNYTEDDVKAATQLFSGFGIDTSFKRNIDPDTGLSRGIMPLDRDGKPQYHDFEPKKFSAKLGGVTITPRGETEKAVYQEIDEFIDMVFAQPETARHICRRLYRFFVYREITDEVEKKVIRPLAELLQKKNYEIKPVLRQLLSSQHFFDAHVAHTDDPQQIIGTMVKSPLEFVLQTVKYFRVKMPSQSGNINLNFWAHRTLSRAIRDLGMELYQPPDVAGYPPYHQYPHFDRNWISANSLADRRRFIDHIIKGISVRNHAFKIEIDVIDFVKKTVSDPNNPEKMVREIADDVFSWPISEERFDYFLNEILLDELSVINWQVEWRAFKKGKSTAVKDQLEKLITAMLQSPEYQLN